MKETIDYLLKMNNVTLYKVAKDTGIAYTTLSDIYKGNSAPKPDKLMKLAEYFGVTVDYLLGNEKDENVQYYLNEETREIAQEIFENRDMRTLFDMSRKMTPDRLKAHIEFMKKLQDSENN